VAPFRPAAEEIELYPHNLWLTTWSELGLLGLVSFATIFFGLMWRGVRALGSLDGVYRAVAWGAVGALVLYLVHGMFDSPYWKNDLSAEFWILAALEVIALRDGVSRQASSKAAG
jgi:O-antigen ligase